MQFQHARGVMLFSAAGARAGLRVLLLIFVLICQFSSCSAGKVDNDPRLARVLQESWRFYRERFITPEGRVLRPENGNDTISEGQAYALLRAVWSEDQPTFDRVYRWTLDNLAKERRDGSRLLAWHWGQDDQGQWRLLDRNSATDADLDYALALILASRRWGKPAAALPEYLAQAQAVLADILRYETWRDPWGRLWLLPGDWAPKELPLLVNPSYFAPAWYRVFAEVSGDRRWLELQESAFFGLQLLSARLGDKAGVGLPPDWARLTGDRHFAPDAGQSWLFGWDAVRIPWRLAVAALWWGQPEAKRWLQENFLPFCRRQFLAFGRLAAIYDYQGQPAVSYESPVLYASLAAAALAAGDRELARQAVDRVLAFYRLGPAGGYFNRPDDYYGNNWAWLGLAAYQGWIRY